MAIGLIAKLGRRRATTLIMSVGLWLAMTPWAAGQAGPGAASPAVAPSQAPAAIASAAVTASITPTPSVPAASVGTVPASTIDRAEIVAFLGAVINWHRQIDMQIRLSSEPEETLFVADDRRMAAEVLRQAFEFARAAAALQQDNSAIIHTPPARTAGGAADRQAATSQTRIPALNALIHHRELLQSLVDELTQAVSELHNKLAGANRKERDSLNREAAAKQAQIDLAKSRIASFDTLIDFEKSTGVAGGSPLGLDAQIEELEHSVAQANGPDANTQPAAGAAAPPTILPGNLDRLLALRQKEQGLGSAMELTDSLAQMVASLRQKLIHSLTEIDRAGLSQTAQVSAADLATLQRTRAQFEALAAQSKLIGAALEPLSKQIVLLQLYSGNLARWRSSVHQRFDQTLRHQFFRALSLALVFGAVFAAAAVWRHLTFRYVEDLQRRQQLLQLRRLALIATLALVLVFGFASELNSLATVMGFAAAGIALALQNVILSIAGYFYLSGRFGIRIGDRVQIAGITGDVLDSGFFKLTLMELSDEERGRQPTGRAVIFPNAVVFQPNSNFFRQLPGTSFVWNELRLTLAPDCDYRQAEQLITEVVEQVFARYRDNVQREYRAMESQLNLRGETPRPQSRLQFGPAGLEMIVRYPTRLSMAMQTADEITRRLVDAIQRDPGLKLAVPGVPSIQAETEPRPDPPDGSRKA